MIDAIKEIGEYALEKEGKSIDNPLNILVENPANRDTKNILFIVLESVKNGFDYKGIKLEEYSKDKLEKYLYRKGTSRGIDETPTSMITGVEKTFKNNKILPWFKEHNNINFLKEIGNCIRGNESAILKDLNNNYTKENNIISLKINNKYIGDYKEFQDILINGAIKNFYLKYGKTSKSKEKKICSVCNHKSEVYGFVDTYKFYTVDKPGFVTGGFRQENAWKNYPVCLNCALILEEGKKYLGDIMNFNFYGFRYLLIPKFVSELDKKTKKEIFKIIEQQQDPNFRKKEINRLTSDEREILKLMSGQKNYLNLNFMFYYAPKGYNGSVFNILFYIEDILPSRLKRLFDVKKEVDNIDIFNECMIPVFENKKKTGEYPLEFNFGVLRTFFPRISDNRTFDKYFLDIVNKIFTNKPIDYNFLMSFIMQRIRDDFINDNPTKISTLKGFMLITYLDKLKIIKHKKEASEMNDKYIEDKWKVFEGNTSNKEKDISQKASSFFSEFASFFDCDAKKAVFLVGVLTQFLLNIQYRERKATPFRIKLKGLNLDEKQVKKLLPEIQNKLEEYGKNYYQKLESIISKYFITAGNNWEMSNDEISFYFVLGMNLSDLFKSENEKNNENIGGEENE
jgi:CRISPR-associated protein Csh1